MAQVEWTSPAFSQLEQLPQPIAFEIVRRVDLLETFPEMGPPVQSRFRLLRSCRQLIVNRTWRVVYQVDLQTSTVWILAIQHCRQKLLSPKEIRRRQSGKPDNEA